MEVHESPRSYKSIVHRRAVLEYLSEQGLPHSYFDNPSNDKTFAMHFNQANTAGEKAVIAEIKRLADENDVTKNPKVRRYVNTE